MSVRGVVGEGVGELNTSCKKDTVCEYVMCEEKGECV